MGDVIKTAWFHYILKSEMPLYKRIIWMMLGKRLENTANGYHVVGYDFKGVTLITVCEEVST